MVRVVERARLVAGVDRIVVATDSGAVIDALAPSGVHSVLTSARHESGTDRVAEVARMPAFGDFDPIVNLQGDEPFVPVAAVEGAIARVLAGDDLGTAAAPLDPELRHDPARVKVVCDRGGRALYFSRAAIPAVRDAADEATTRWWQHIGVYAYRRSALLALAALPPTDLERAERLEQLRALDARFTVGVALLDAPAPAGIDTPDDLAAAEARWRELAEVSR